MIAPDGLAYFGCTVANALKKYPSRAIAKGIRAPLIEVPFNVTTIESAMAQVMTAALAGPSTILVITETADFEAASSCAGITYCTAAFINMYRTPTTAIPAINPQGMFFCGSLISPATIVRSFHPSYAHNAATRAIMNPECDGGTDVCQFCHVPAL